MNPEAPIVPQPPRRRRVWLAVALVCLAGLLAVPAWGWIASTRAQSQIESVQRQLLAELPGSWSPRIRVSAGPALLGLARTALRLVKLPPEARTALGAVRGFRVAVHQLRSGEPARGEMLRAADAVMARAAWERVVGVVEDDSLVAVYLPGDARVESDLRLCVLVQQRDELIVVSGHGELEPLLRLAAAHLDGKSAPGFALTF